MAYFLADGVINPTEDSIADLLDKIIELTTANGWTLVYDNGLPLENRMVALKGTGDADVDPYAIFLIKRNNGGAYNFVVRCATGFNENTDLEFQDGVSLGRYDPDTDIYYSTVFTLGVSEFSYFIQCSENHIIVGGDSSLSVVFLYVGLTDRDPYGITQPEEFPYSAVCIANATNSYQTDSEATGCATVSNHEGTGSDPYLYGCTGTAFIDSKWKYFNLAGTGETTERDVETIYSELLTDRGGQNDATMVSIPQFPPSDNGDLKLDRIFYSDINNPFIHFLKNTYLISGYTLPRIGLMKSADGSKTYVLMQPTNSTDQNRFFCVELV